MQPDFFVNACDLQCPLPLLAARRALSELKGGQWLKIAVNNVTSWQNLSRMTKQTGHRLIANGQGQEAFWILIEKNTE